MADKVASTIIDAAVGGLTALGGLIRQIPGEYGEVLGGLVEDVASNFLYKDGVSETRYGMSMERSWSGSTNSFLKNLKNNKIEAGNININFSKKTPLDPAENSASNLYGNLLLGTPPVFTDITDPNNRVIINTFVKDAVFLSLTPGLPKFNGGFSTQSLRSLATQVVNDISAGIKNNEFTAGSGQTSGTYLTQTKTAEEAMNYLLKNGIDPAFAEKDTRYYTFQAKYNDYYSYLETMLNALWIKLGLGTENENTFNIFSFFNPKNNTANYSESLQEKYKSSIGFYVSPSISESVSNSELSTDLADDANRQSDEFQKLNYITGMGTDTVGLGRRAAGVIGTQVNTLKQTWSELTAGAEGFGKQIWELSKSLTYKKDLSSIIQAFSVTNGMKVMYPNLWQNSNYSKNLNFNFNFVSPYGDPLSIFQYVYVPFFALLTFVLPRQAAENGYVSPFFVRADVPGLITSDLALISDLTWTKGGESNLWTKDKLPRAISGSFTVTDLYPYLSMVKRFSFLSANPSFTVFLDNMSGIGALYNGLRSDPLNTYWKQLINRISGEGNSSIINGLWNNFDENKRLENSGYMNLSKNKIGKNLNPKKISWMHNISK